jgi:hypothetical protein
MIGNPASIPSYSVQFLNRLRAQPPAHGRSGQQRATELCFELCCKPSRFPLRVRIVLVQEPEFLGKGDRSLGSLCLLKRWFVDSRWHFAKNMSLEPPVRSFGQSRRCSITRICLKNSASYSLTKLGFSELTKSNLAKNIGFSFFVRVMGIPSYKCPS